MYIKVNKSNYTSCFTEAMTKHMAVEWGPDRIRVMCVAPGPIGDTEGMNRLGILHRKLIRHTVK